MAEMEKREEDPLRSRRPCRESGSPTAREEDTGQDLRVSQPLIIDESGSSTWEPPPVSRPSIISPPKRVKGATEFQVLFPYDHRGLGMVLKPGYGLGLHVAEMKEGPADTLAFIQPTEDFIVSVNDWDVTAMDFTQAVVLVKQLKFPKRVVFRRYTYRAIEKAQDKERRRSSRRFSPTAIVREIVNTEPTASRASEVPSSSKSQKKRKATALVSPQPPEKKAAVVEIVSLDSDDESSAAGSVLQPLELVEQQLHTRPKGPSGPKTRSSLAGLQMYNTRFQKGAIVKTLFGPGEIKAHKVVLAGSEPSVVYTVKGQGFMAYAQEQTLVDLRGIPVTRYPRNATKNGINVTEADIFRLGPGQYLNDNVIDFYFRYLEQTVTTGSSFRKVLFMSSFFFKSLMQASEKHSEEGSYKIMSRWTKAVDIFSCDFILVPVNDAMHWSLAVICNPGVKPQSSSSRPRGQEPIKKKDFCNPFAGCLVPATKSGEIHPPSKSSMEHLVSNSSPLPEASLSATPEPSTRTREAVLSGGTEDMMDFDVEKKAILSQNSPHIPSLSALPLRGLASFKEDTLVDSLLKRPNSPLPVLKSIEAPTAPTVRLDDAEVHPALSSSFEGPENGRQSSSMNPGPCKESNRRDGVLEEMASVSCSPAVEGAALNGKHPIDIKMDGRGEGLGLASGADHDGDKKERAVDVEAPTILDNRTELLEEPEPPLGSNHTQVNVKVLRAKERDMEEVKTAVGTDRTEQGKRTSAPCILMLDSSKCHRTQKVVKLLRTFLSLEWKHRKEKELGARKFAATALPAVVPATIPRQDNGCDCGVFLLHYAELLATRPPMIDEEFIRSKGVKGGLDKSWFRASEIKQKRRKIKELILTLAQDEVEGSMGERPGVQEKENVELERVEGGSLPESSSEGTESVMGKTTMIVEEELGGATRMELEKED